MSAQINPAGEPTPIDATEQAKVGGRSSPAEQFSLTQGIKSMEELERVAPKVADAMKQAIVQQILSGMQKHSARLKQINQQARQS